MAETLTVKVLAGRGLIPCDRGGTSDPYCVISIGSNSHKTKVIKKTLSPEWAESDPDPFSFHVDQNSPSEIVFEVFDWNRFSQHKPMGRARINIKELGDGQEYNRWIPLSPSKEGEKVSGDIHVSAQSHREGRRAALSVAKSFMNENSYEDEPPLFTAIKNSDLETVRKLISNPDLNINMRDKFGYTPLHAACVLFSDRDDEILSLLLRHKDINVNIENEDKNTPLHYFCQKFRSPNCADAFEIFIEKGANVNASNNLGETPLHKAIFNNSVKILMVNLLIKARADVNKTNNQGETALHYVVRFGREDLVSILLKGGADANIRGNKEKKTPYELAVEAGYDKMAASFIRAKELYDWLEEIGMERYHTAFMKEELYKDLIPDIDDHVLDKIGSIPQGHRLKIIKGAKVLKEEQEKNKPKNETTKEESDNNNNNNNNSKQPEVNKSHDIEQELEKLKYINKSGTWILHNSELEFAVKLGSGTSGTVYKGLYKREEVAIKVLKSEQSSKELEEFKKEFQIMSSIQSPYLVFFFGAVLEPKMCMVMELCSRGSLYHVMSDNKLDIGWERCFGFAKEMVKGVDTLHSWTPQVVHRDLKSLNLMVNEQWHVKVADFGLSRFNTDTQKDTLVKMRGTFAYCAPEVYFGEQFSSKADVFSIAIMLWELVTRCIKREYMRPYQEFPNLHFDFQIIIQTAKKGVRPTIPPSCPESLVNLIKSAWHHEADKRPTCGEIVTQLESIEQDFIQNTETWNSYIDPPKGS